MNLYPGDVIQVNEAGFDGFVCAIDQVSSDYVRLELDGVFGDKRWIKKSKVELKRRPIINCIRATSTQCFLSMRSGIRRITNKLKER